MYKATKTEKLLKQIFDNCGFDGSESSTEDFVVMLYEVADNVLLMVDGNHEGGLCTNALAALADGIDQEGPKWAEQHKQRMEACRKKCAELKKVNSGVN